MGVRLMVEAMDHAPESLTHRERYVLVVLAESARDSTRVCMPGIEDDERFVRRARLGRTERYAVIKSLIAKGAVERTRRGQKGVRAEFAISRLAPTQHPENPDPDESDSVRETRTLNTPQGPENPDAENPDADTQGPGLAHSGSGFGPFRVRDSRTPSPHSPHSPHTYDARAGDGPDGQQALTDPPKRTKPRTAAPDPDQFVVDPAMRAWAADKTPRAEIDHETRQFLDHHAAKGSRFTDWRRAWQTWMRNAHKWAAEREPPADNRPPRTRHRPWQPPTDHSAYEEPL